MNTTNQFDPGFLNVTIWPGAQHWNAVYLDYQLSVLRSLIEADTASGGSVSGCGPFDSDGHPLQGIYDHLAEVLDRCGYRRAGGAA